jgi:hypothetical protein
LLESLSFYVTRTVTQIQKRVTHHVTKKPNNIKDVTHVTLVTHQNTYIYFYSKKGLKTMSKKTSNTTVATDNLPLGTEVLAVQENDTLGLSLIGTLTEYTADGIALVRCPGAGTIRAASIEPLHKSSN